MHNEYGELGFLHPEVENLHKIAQKRIYRFKERIGQAYFNAADYIDSKWANSMINTIDDPYYNDENLHRFLEIWYHDHE